MKKKRPVNRDASRDASEGMRTPIPQDHQAREDAARPAPGDAKASPPSARRGETPAAGGGADVDAGSGKGPGQGAAPRVTGAADASATAKSAASADSGDTRRVPRINRSEGARPGSDADARWRPEGQGQGTHVVPDRRTVSDDEYDAFMRASRQFDEEVQGRRPQRVDGRPSQAQSQSWQEQLQHNRGRSQGRGAYGGPGQATPTGSSPRRMAQAQARGQRPGAPYPARDPRAGGQRQSGQDIPRIDLKTGRPLAPGEAPSEQRGGWVFYLFLILEILLVGGTVWLSRLVLVYDIGTQLHQTIFFGGAVLVHALLIALLVRGYKRPIPRYIGSFLSLLLVVVVGIGIYYGQLTTDTLDRIQVKPDTEDDSGIEDLTASKSRYGLSLVVRADQPYHLPEELSGKPVAVPEGDKPEVEAYLETLRKDEGLELDTVPVKNYFDGVQAVYDRKAEGAVIVSGTLAMMKDDHPEIESEMRVINFYAFPKETLENKIVKDPSQQPFNVYISGVDTYDDLGGSARSDVNIVVTIDPYEHEILLTNIPRDSYIPIYDRGDGEYDKLTHAGIYGVRSSIISLEKFLDIDINYYLRVNFNSLIRLVDEFGGVVITNPYEFQTNDGKYYYPKGRIMLDGDKALWYVRERYNLPEGDLSRGEHQQIVLEALIQEALSPEILNNYSSILDVLGDSMETNMPPQHLMQLVTHQLAENPSWDIAMEQVTGTADQRPSYAAGGQELSVVIPDEDSVNACKDKIHAILGKD